MEIKSITTDEFEKSLVRSTKSAPPGYNKKLLRKAESTPMKLTFETARRAVSKVTALYVVRREMNAQVRIFRQDRVLYLGPGEYFPTTRSKKEA